MIDFPVAVDQGPPRFYPYNVELKWYQSYLSFPVDTILDNAKVWAVNHKPSTPRPS